ncbi:hypothetical protein VC83_09608 [Pseudogymnoascus destructans]|uniref:Retroviral polymerase SH3-like domain-containing protein n=1 Tax=Pseudogymnoascus destructans TaxID=655981 RepID=A0A2P6FGH0_9PEZI|nr:uncharacterized protein VC83_09608 [Pseudogymnoascus destructans]PQM43481.1 hypothetical protein VC83_09608 [Pseudogymnoascus destructans]
MEQRGGDKLAPNAIRTALVGYMPTSKQYRLYDPVGDRILIATSVRFVESQILDLQGNDSDEGSPEDVGFDPMGAYVPQEPAIEAEEPGDQSGSAPEEGPPIGDIADRPAVTPHEQLLGWRDRISGEDGSQDDGSDQLFLEEEDDLGSPGDQILVESEAALREVPPAEEPIVRRSERERRPTRLFEGALEASTPSKIPIPERYSEAINDPDHGADWALAVKEELAQLQSLGTWELAKLPRGKRVLGRRWVFNVKYTPRLRTTRPILGSLTQWVTQLGE